MERGRILHLRTLGVACLAFLVIAGVAGAASLQIDLDRDGLDGQAERRIGSSAFDADTDADGLPDGWESSRGLAATTSDADRDGLDDDVEIAQGSDPLLSDTDGDGLSDLAENPAADGGPDCDQDGAPAVRESDDDADGRPDALEDSAQRCDADMDDDGVLDGHELNPSCILAADCDGDGVSDAEEAPAGFDPLDPDTFDVHLPDGVSYAFAKSGQLPSRDGDLDGIPDSWENQTGLIDWGPFTPRAGERDLFVEFVRVLGPDSSRFADLSLAGAYERVASAFRTHAIEFQYVETVVSLDTEPVAASKPSSTTSYYRTVLEEARFSANPYVLTVVLNPQHDQSQIVHAGIAPLRGMLAAVEVSQFVEFTMQDVEGNYTLTHMTPFSESLIAGGRVSQAGLAGENLDGTYYMVIDGREIRWTPYWFRGPTIEHSDGRRIPLVVAGRVVFDDELAHTVLHEIGHTLGLCHTHEEDCKAKLPLDEQSRDAESSMSYYSPDELVAYLPSEWDLVQGYLSCPPPTPIRLVAEGASADARLDSKYAYEFDPDPANAGRSCEDYEPLVHSFDAVLASTRYDPPPDRAAPPTPYGSPAPAVAYWTGATGIAAFAAFSAGRWLPRRT